MDKKTNKSIFMWIFSMRMRIIPAFLKNIKISNLFYLSFTLLILYFLILKIVLKFISISANEEGNKDQNSSQGFLASFISSIILLIVFLLSSYVLLRSQRTGLCPLESKIVTFDDPNKNQDTGNADSVNNSSSLSFGFRPIKDDSETESEFEESYLEENENVEEEKMQSYSNVNINSQNDHSKWTSVKAFLWKYSMKVSEMVLIYFINRKVRSFTRNENGALHSLITWITVMRLNSIRDENTSLQNEINYYMDLISSNYDFSYTVISLDVPQEAILALNEGPTKAINDLEAEQERNIATMRRIINEIPATRQVAGRYIRMFTTIISLLRLYRIVRP